jgi:hypothetical protein
MNHDTSTKQDKISGKDWSIRRLRALATKQIRERPLMTAGLTVAAGFVIGGGLASGTTLRVLRRSVGVALQMAVIPALLTRLREALLDEVEA